MEYYYYLNKGNKKIVLICQCIKNDDLYEAEFVLNDGEFILNYVSKNYKEVEIDKYFCNTKTYDIDDKNNNLNIALDCEFFYNDDEIIPFHLNKTFDLKFELKGFSFVDMPDSFKVKWIEDKFKLKYFPNIYCDIIDILFKLVKFAEKKTAIPDIIRFSNNISFDENIKLVQDFLNSNNINISLKDLIDNGNLNFITENFCNYSIGESYYDFENKKKKIDILISNDILESAALLHELMHFYNQPDGNRNAVSDDLTEIISYGYEFIFLYSLFNTEYSNDVKKLTNELVGMLHHISNIIYSPCLTIKVLKENDGHLVKESIENSLNFDSYLNDMCFFVENRYCLIDVTRSFLGYIFGLYCYMEYIKDNSFIYKLKELNDSINTKSMEECLAIIGINSKEEFMTKPMNAINEYNKIFEDKPKVLN